MSELTDLEGWSFPVHTSPGGEVRARSIADQAERMKGWLTKVAPDLVIPDLYVVGPDDWDGVATIPVYGMPHAEPDRIVVGQQPAAFWDVVLASVENYLTEEDWAALRRVYGDPPDIGGFADLLVSHEIGHYLHTVDDTKHPTSFWLRELLANLALQGYVSEVEPELEAASGPSRRRTTVARAPKPRRGEKRRTSGRRTRGPRESNDPGPAGR